jgi:hypothetical protein
MATIKVTFEKATAKYAEGLRIECPGVNLWMTIEQAESLAQAIMIKVRNAKG